MNNEKTIKLILKMDDQVSKGANSAANSLKKMGDSITSFGTKMTTGITMPIVAAGAAMFKTFADFESVIAELGARTGATAEEMKKMSDYALEMGRNTAFSATEAAQALLELTSSGSSAAEAMEMLPYVLNLAAAGALDLGQAADGVTDILAQFQKEAEAAEWTTNMLAKAAGASSASVDDLLQGFKNVGTVAHQFGMNIDETAAALAVLAENGIKGAESGTALKSMLLNMSNTTEPVAEAWSKLGLSMYDAQGNMRGIDEIFKDINKAMEGMTMEEQNAIARDLAGSYGILGFNALRASNGISDMDKAMSNAAGAEEVAAARMNTLAGKFDNMIGSIEGLAIVLGGLAQGPLLWLIEGVTNAVNAFSEWAAANPMLAQTIMIILAIVAAIGPLLIIIGQLITAWGVLVAAVPAITAGIGAIGAAFMFLLTPLGLFLAGFALIVAAILGNWWGLRDGIVWGVGEIVKAASLMGDVFKIMGQAVIKGWEMILTDIGTTISQIGQLIWHALNKLTGGAFDMGVAIISGLIKGIASKAVDLIAYVLGLSKELTFTIKRALGIASPSKVFMDIGKNVVQGFNNGIESMGGGLGVNVPQMQGGGASSGQPSLAMAGGASGGNVFNIYTAAGTTDQQAQEIAQKVSRIIADDAKRKGAR